ncbi:MAG: L-fucose/L-arabinose isomerase family protein [Cyclobacteriaceae bacterium]
MKKLKLGYMPTRRAFFSKEEALKYKSVILEEINKLMADKVEIFDLEWLNDEGLLYDDQDSDKVAKYFIQQEVDALFAPHCNFGTENAVAQVAKKVAKPFLLWGPRDDAPLPSGKRLRDTQCGLFATSKVLQRYKVPFTYIINSKVTDPVFQKGFTNFIRAANVVKSFKNMRIGQIASRPQSFYTLIVNENELLEKFGIEVIPINLSTIVRQVKEALKIKKEELVATVEDIENRADFSNLNDDATEKIAALKYVMQQNIERFNLDAVAFQCWEELQFQLGICSCFVHASITEEGTPFACEADIHGAISSLMLQSAGLFEESTFFADLTIRHPEDDNAELLWHCGVFPPSLSKSKEGTKIGDHFILPSHATGTCNWQIKDGDITVIRFDGANGKYSLFCGEAKTTEGPYTLGTYVYIKVNDWPKWEEKIIYGPYIHHTSCIYGKYAPVLYEACRYLNGVTFDPVEPNEEEIKNYLRSN